MKKSKFTERGGNVKKGICSGISYLLVWICSGITLLAYKDGDVVLAVMATLFSIVSIPLMYVSK